MMPGWVSTWVIGAAATWTVGTLLAGAGQKPDATWEDRFADSFIIVVVAALWPLALLASALAAGSAGLLWLGARVARRKG